MCTTPLLLVFAFWAWASLSAQERYDPAAVAQEGLDLQSSLTVLTVALQPGFEDFEALAYLRTVRGARLATLYITNGESGSSDDGLHIPGEIAFHKRAEAYEAMRRAEGFELFVNMPDFGSASDTLQVRQWWHPDTLQQSLAYMIRNIRPDLILLAADLESRGGPSPRWSVLRDDLMASVRLAAVERRGVGAASAWEVTAVLADNGDGIGLTFPVPHGQKGRGPSASMLVDSIAGAYGSLRIQLPMWRKGRGARYDILKAPRGRTVRFADDGVPPEAPARLRWIDREVRKLNLGLQKKTASGMSASNPLRYEQNWVVAIMDSVDFLISRQGGLSNRERKSLLHWKEGLEELRNAIFGVDVAYRFSDSVLLANQVTTVTIDSVKGVPPGGTTELFFPDVGRRWIAGQNAEQRQTLELGKSYTLISPKAVELDLPATYGGQGRPSHGTPFPFFVFHTGASLSESFFKKLIVRHLFSPKLSVEPLTPIVRIVPGEQVVVRLTNHAHDRLRDSFGVQDSLAHSPLDTIALRVKGSVLIDTLALTWNPAIEEGTYRVPFVIGGYEVGYFAARKFDAAIDSLSHVALVAAFGDSPVVQSLRRLGIKHRILSDDWGPEDLEGSNVLLVDERAMSMSPELGRRRESIEQFATSGGRLVILAQDVQAWNGNPLVEGIRLTETNLLDGALPVVLDSTQRIALTPNLISGEDWEGWLFTRSKSRAEISDSSIAILASDATGGVPLITRCVRGSGEIVYVNLSLSTQLMNIHPGAYRVLANLLSRP